MYFKRYGVLVAVLSFISLAAFYMAIIPAEAVVPSMSLEYSDKYVGGVQAEMLDKSVFHDENVPRNADGEKLKYVGTFKVTHYCACTICTGGSGITASGKHVEEGMIASDWRVLPKGTKVYIKSGDSLLEKVVEDTGGAIKGNIIDVYVSSHERALKLGVYYTDLYVDPDTVLP